MIGERVSRTCVRWHCGLTAGRNHTNSCIVRRLLFVRYGEYLLVPDGDLTRIARELGMDRSVVCRIAWRWGFRTVKYDRSQTMRRLMQLRARGRSELPTEELRQLATDLGMPFEAIYKVAWSMGMRGSPRRGAA